MTGWVIIKVSHFFVPFQCFHILSIGICLLSRIVLNDCMMGIFFLSFLFLLGGAVGVVEFKSILPSELGVDEWFSACLAFNHFLFSMFVFFVFVVEL